MSLFGLVLIVFAANCIICCLSYRFYVYEWPEITNKYSKSRSDHAYDPFFVNNDGAGLAVNESIGLYSTWQFALFKLMYERSLKDPRRTRDPSLATTFVIPYDLGLDACFRSDNGKMRKINCPLAHAVIHRLHSSMYFNASGGKDHLLIVSVNQNMNYFLGASKCQSFLSTVCYNCTKIAIDEYSFLHSINRKEAALDKRGDYWHAVPFPANTHYSSRVVPPYTWARSKQRRSVIMSYTGSRGSFNHVAARLRGGIGANCDEYANHTRPDGLTACATGRYHVHPGREELPLAGKSVFCFQPPGDMSTRKSVFDSILMGCIPVFFAQLTGPLMYEWHWDQQLWEDASVSLHTIAKQAHASWDEKAPKSKRLDVVRILLDLYDNHRDIVEAKQLLIEQYAYRLQYSLDTGLEATQHLSSGLQREDPPVNVVHVPPELRAIVGDMQQSRRREISLPAGLRTGTGPMGEMDAYEISMGNVLAIHAGLKTHNRTAHFMRCEDPESYIVDWCASTNSSVDVRVDW